VIDRAFIDESIRMSAEGYVYLLAAVCPTPRTGPLLSLRPVLLPGQRYVHWRDETNIRRTAFIEAVNTMAFDVTVTVMERVPNGGQERARAACMLALATEFDRDPGVRWEIEGRREQLDQRDVDTIHNADRDGELSNAPTVNFVSKSASPALWVADAADSAAHFAGAGRSGHWWRPLRFSRLVALAVEP
jgi:hypothetical protein